MDTYRKELESKLNTLLEKTIDAEKRYLKTADNSKHSDLKTLFAKKSKERLEQALKLEKTALNKYEKVLGDVGLPPTTSTILTKQNNIILANLETVKVLADVD